VPIIFRKRLTLPITYEIAKRKSSPTREQIESLLKLLDELTAQVETQKLCWLSRFGLTLGNIACQPERCYLHARGRCEVLREALRPERPLVGGTKQCWLGKVVDDKSLTCSGEACKFNRRCEELRRSFGVL